MSQVVLVDFSGLAYPIWAMSQSEANPNHASQAIVSRIRDKWSSVPHVAICCDTGRTFRHDLDLSYKANREAKDATLTHQMKLAIEQLRADGFPIWAAQNFESDDLIASAVVKLGAHEVLIVSDDKDLCQLVGPGVTITRPSNGVIVDAAGVMEKFGVAPVQMLDYLCLVGDKADNIVGADGIGPKKASALLTKYGSIDAIYRELTEIGGASMGLTVSMAKALKDFEPRRELTRKLVALAYDVPVSIDDLWVERQAAAAGQEAFVNWDEEDDVTMSDPGEVVKMDVVSGDAPAQSTTEIQIDRPIRVDPSPAPAAPNHQETSIAVRGEVMPVEFERELEPRSIQAVVKAAQSLFASRLFHAQGHSSWESIMATILLGREYGLQMMSSLRSIHIIKERQALSAQLVVGICLKRKEVCQYFRMKELIPGKSCTFVAKRVGDDPAIELTHTIEMAEKAGLLKSGSNWLTVPDDMLVARCSMRLARIVFADLVANVYDESEMREMRETA